MKRLFFCAALLFLFLFSAGTLLSAAEQKIGVINLEKVFREYYKSRVTEQFISRRAEAIRAYLSQMNGQLDAMKAEARKLGTNAYNPVLSSEEREKAESAAAEALKKVRVKEAEIQQFTSESAAELRKLETDKRAEIIAEIKAEAERRAAAEGYTFILDCSGKTTNDQPAVLVYSEKNDITESVIRELNRTANSANQGAKK